LPLGAIKRGDDGVRVNLFLPRHLAELVDLRVRATSSSRGAVIRHLLVEALVRD
jgi:hypothetical protein